MGEQREQETDGGLWAPCLLCSTKGTFKKNGVQKAIIIINVTCTYYKFSLYFWMLIQWFHILQKVYFNFENSYSVIIGCIWEDTNTKSLLLCVQTKSTWKLICNKTMMMNMTEKRSERGWSCCNLWMKGGRGFLGVRRRSCPHYSQ